MGLKKGDVVLAIGKIQTRNYTDGNGEEKTAKELVCEAVFAMGYVSEAETPKPSTPSYAPSGGDFMNVSVNDDDLPF